MRPSRTKRTNNHDHGISSNRASCTPFLVSVPWHRPMYCHRELNAREKKIIEKKINTASNDASRFQAVDLHFDESSGDGNVDDCVDVDCAANSVSVGVLITELSLSDSSSISACTLENTPNRAKWSKKTFFVFNMISSSMLSTTK